MSDKQLKMDRRSFLKAAFASGAVATSGVALAACAPQTTTATPTADTGSSASAAGASWESPAPTINPEEITQVIDADIVVVGAGISGVSAAQSAAEEGARVVVLEKTAQANGRGLDIGNIGSTWQNEHPEVSKYIDAAEAEKIFFEFQHSAINRLLFRFWAQNSGEAFDHLAEHMSSEYGIEPAMSATAPQDRFDAVDYYREMPTCQSFGEGWYDADGKWLMEGVVDKVWKWAESLGAEFLFNTPAEQLITDESGAVTGVIGKSEEGYVQVNAAKGVILATGDIGGNEEMLARWCPIALRAGANVYTPAGVNTGDGIKMGLWAGATTQQGYPAPMIHPMGPGGPLAQAGEGLGFLCVNANGERFTCELNNTPGMANSLLTQPKGIGYTIFDGGYHDKVLAMKPENIAITGLPIVDDTTQQTIDEAVAAGDGLCFCADSIADLADQLGMDAASLQATVDRYNELVAQGEDTDMSLPSELLTPLDTPPYYASRIPQAILVVIYGLRCDSHSRVCNADDEPIPGLYAIGNVQGDFFSHDYPLVCPGISHGRCVTFGYKLPKAILNDELITVA